MSHIITTWCLCSLNTTQSNISTALFPQKIKCCFIRAVSVWAQQMSCCCCFLILNCACSLVAPQVLFIFHCTVHQQKMWIRFWYYYKLVVVIYVIKWLRELQTKENIQCQPVLSANKSSQKHQMKATMNLTFNEISIAWCELWMLAKCQRDKVPVWIWWL